MSIVKLKRSAVSGKIPNTTDLELGELAINTFDGKLYLKKDDGSESIIDLTNADTLDGQEGSYYQNASNLNAGTISDDRLPATITSDITGNSATATKLETARAISLGGDVSGSASFDGSANITITATVSDNSHNHTVSNITDFTSGANTAIDNRVTKSFVDALNVDADTLDSLNSTQFLRSDTSDTLSGSLTITGNVTIDELLISTETGSTSSTTQTSIASFVASTYSSGKFIIQATDSVSGEVHVTELLIVHDGTTASATEYGTIHTGAAPLAAYEVDINSGNVRILATAASSNSTTYKVTENLITA